jgi:hypothetical protein
LVIENKEIARKPSEEWRKGDRIVYKKENSPDIRRIADSNGYSKIAEGIRIILSSHDNNKFKSGMIDALTSGKFRKFTDELILLIQNKRKEFVNYKEAFENQVLSKTDWIGRTLTDFELADIQSQIIKVDKIISELDLALDRNSKIPSSGAKKKRT